MSYKLNANNLTSAVIGEKKNIFSLCVVPSLEESPPLAQPLVTLLVLDELSVLANADETAFSTRWSSLHAEAPS